MSSKNFSETLSVYLSQVILLLYISNLAILTPVTLISQIAGIQFKEYSIVASIVSFSVSGFVLVNAKKGLKTIVRNDYINLIGLALLGTISVFIALSYYRVGRIAVDEFYSTANPTFYLNNQSQPMSFETRVFYSGDRPFHSVAYLTAGAYEYSLAVFSSLTGIYYLSIYYQLAAGTAAFLLPMTIFLLLNHFSTDALSALIGTVAVITVEIITAESAVTPGGFAFIRIYEGKSIMLALGIPLFITYAIDFFHFRTRFSQVKLFLLITALSGATTTSLMILPMLGAIIPIAYMIAQQRWDTSLRPLMKDVVDYLLCYLYLALYATFIIAKDGLRTAAFSMSYPTDFQGYLAFFGPITAPTPLLTIFFTLGALFQATGFKRTFLGWWIGLSILLALNPVTSNILIVPFKGIFYRMFYILPFPISAGVFISDLSSHVAKIKRKRISTIGNGLIIGIFALSTLVIPSSIFRNKIYATGSWRQHEEYMAAEKIISKTPKGIMLSPYPISGAIRMLSSDYPQMITREDMMYYYLSIQDREMDAEFRIQANRFLSGDLQDMNGIAKLLDQYTEVYSVVLDRAVYKKYDSNQLNSFLRSKGFVNKATVGKYIVFWK